MASTNYTHLHNICQETSNRYNNQHPDEHQRYVLQVPRQSRTRSEPQEREYITRRGQRWRNKHSKSIYIKYTTYRKFQNSFYTILASAHLPVIKVQHQCQCQSASGKLLLSLLQDQQSLPEKKKNVGKIIKMFMDLKIEIGYKINKGYKFVPP